MRFEDGFQDFGFHNVILLICWTDSNPPKAFFPS